MSRSVSSQILSTSSVSGSYSITSKHFSSSSPMTDSKSESIYETIDILRGFGSSLCSPPCSFYSSCPPSPSPFCSSWPFTLNFIGGDRLKKCFPSDQKVYSFRVDLGFSFRMLPSSWIYILSSRVYASKQMNGFGKVSAFRRYNSPLR